MRWLMILVAALFVVPAARAQDGDLTPEERQASYCFGVAVEMDHQGVRNRLSDYLDAHGFHPQTGHREPLAYKLKYEIGAVGARDAQICKTSPGGQSCKEIDVCRQPTG